MQGAIRRRLLSKDVQITNPHVFVDVNRVIYLRDRCGNLLALDRVISVDPAKEEQVSVQTMIDQVSGARARALSGVRAEMRRVLAELRRERDIALEEYRQRARRQLDNAEAALQAALRDYRITPRPEWPRVIFLERSDFPDTHLTHDLAERMRKQALAEMQVAADSFWDFTFIENAYKLGLYNAEGKIDYGHIMVRNRFRNVIRKTKDDYQRRLALEKDPSYKGRRLVTMDNSAFVFKALELSIENQKYWDKVLDANAEMQRQLNKAALKRSLWYSERQKTIRALIAQIRLCRQNTINNLRRFRDRYSKLFHAAETAYRAKMTALEAALQYDEYQYLQVTRGFVEDPSRRIVPFSGDRQITIRFNAVTGDHASEIGADRGTKVRVRPVEFGPGRSNYVQPNTLLDAPLSRGTVGECLARLGRGDHSSDGTNVLSMLFELRDIPKSVESIRNMFLWMRRSYSARKLAHISFRDGAEAYLEYIYGVKPTYDSILYLIGELRSFIEWIRTMVDPSPLLTVKVGKTQSASLKIMHESDVAKNEPLAGRVHNVDWAHFDYPVYSTSPIEPVNLVTDEGISPEFRWSCSTFDFLDRYNPALEIDNPICLFDYQTVTSLKCFARPVREIPTLWDIRKAMLRGFIWDNSLGETFWNWVPFSFIADWFFGLKDVFKGLDQLLVSGWHGLEKLYQPWFRRVDEARFDVVTPLITVGFPTISVGTVYSRRPWEDRSSAFAARYSYHMSNRIEIDAPVHIILPWASSKSKFRKVIRDEIPHDTTDLLVDALRERAARAFTIRPSNGRVFAISSQVLALGTANEAFTGVKPRGRKPPLKIRKDLKVPKSGLFTVDLEKNARSAIKLAGFSLRR